MISKRFFNVILVAFILFLNIGIVCAPIYDDIEVAEVVRVYDGDTFMVHINGYPSIIGDNISIRISGIDAPEMRTKDSNEKIMAYIAREALKEKLNSANVIILKNVMRGKYFRIVADVYADGENISEYMLLNGFAVEY